MLVYTRFNLINSILLLLYGKFMINSFILILTGKVGKAKSVPKASVKINMEISSISRYTDT